jgi:cation-transporting ATPase E
VTASPERTPAPEVQATAGLTDEEVALRVREGRVNTQPPGASRSTAAIVRANVFTRFNALLGILLVVAVGIGPIQDTLFGMLLVFNSGIGIVQELRAKRVLDRFRVLNAPSAYAIRSGRRVEVPLEQVVLDDVLEMGAGDEVVVDGVVLDHAGLEVDESLLTGESEPVTKDAGDEVLSGSFVVAGSGHYRAVRVGADAYAGALASVAQTYTLVNSELSKGINQILRWITWAIIPTMALLMFSQLRTDDTVDALRGVVAGGVAMVPEGLVLLTTMAFAVGVIRLGKHRVLVQQLPAIEVLARVDVLCMDKTGTITEGRLGVVEVQPLDDGADGTDGSLGTDRALEALGALAAIDPRPNATLRAIGQAAPAPDGWQALASVPFSSARRWSAADFGPKGTWVLGAAEALVDGEGDGQDGTRARVDALARSGRRIVVLAKAQGPSGPSEREIPGALDGEHLPARILPVALVVLEDKVRPDSARTVRYFAEQGVALKVLSGDHPGTVGSVADQVGLETAHGAVDARDLPDDRDELGRILDDNQVFGRVSPQQKEAMVDAMQARGHVVAMIGDGVNDVPSLKSADIGVALGSGTDASRVVAELVLLDSSFAGLPFVVREGRRVLSNVQRVANLFLTKTVYAFLLAIAVGVAGLPFPFLPRHLTLVGALTIGIPSFFLAFAHRAPRAHGNFVHRVLRFAGPAGGLAAAATFTAYALARVTPEVSLVEARTTATIVLVAFGIALLARVARPLSPGRVALVAAMALAYIATLTIPFLQEFFLLNPPPPIVVLAALGSAGLAMWAFELVSRQLEPEPE